MRWFNTFINSVFGDALFGSNIAFADCSAVLSRSDKSVVFAVLVEYEVVFAGIVICFV